jgi:hypothetical protein
VNQRDSRGLTPLHRAAFLAHQDGYLEIYEYLLVRKGDRSACDGRQTATHSLFPSRALLLRRARARTPPS